ncbi:CHAT domain-containing protein [Alphaproteobacteria bacterium]|nr:CHAT domain-containing protein [Alphaproteobacteria bacterium]
MQIFGARSYKSAARDYLFATHGLVAGELAGVSEAALVLNILLKGVEADNGLLKASVVAQLKLDTDWVILSGCNTAAADGTFGARSLSGLAKAFCCEGRGALLVSHWPVLSDVAVALIVRILEAAKTSLTRAYVHPQALR